MKRMNRPTAILLLTGAMFMVAFNWNDYVLLLDVLSPLRISMLE